MNSVEKLVHSFPTAYASGLLRAEIKSLIKEHFPRISSSKFIEVLESPVTCARTPDGITINKEDILRAIYSGIEGIYLYDDERLYLKDSAI